MYMIFGMYRICLFWFATLAVCLVFFFFFKQKTAYEMRISDWSSDVCSSDLLANERMVEAALPAVTHHMHHELVALGDAQRLLLYGAAVGIDVDLGHRSPAD